MRTRRIRRRDADKLVSEMSQEIWSMWQTRAKSDDQYQKVSRVMAMRKQKITTSSQWTMRVFFSGFQATRLTCQESIDRARFIPASGHYLGWKYVN